MLKTQSQHLINLWSKDLQQELTNNQRHITTYFSNNSAEDQWSDWKFDDHNGINAVVEFFQSSNTSTPTYGGPAVLRPIGKHYAYLEASSPDLSDGKNAMA